MLKHLGEPTEKAMLYKFFLKANEPCKYKTTLEGPIKQGISPKGRKKLKSDLKLLINSKTLPNEISQQAKVLIINGEQDKIISSSTKQSLIKDLTNHLDQTPLNWDIKDEGHCMHLPFLTNQVSNWLETI